MKKPLDENYVFELKEFTFGPEGTGFLSIDQDNWKEELYRQERKINAGCVALFIILFIILFSSMFVQFRGLPLLVYWVGFLGIFYKWIQARRFKNLRMHGQYQYEVYHDRIVRYSNTWFRKFHLSEIRSITQKSYGLLIIRKFRFQNYFLNHKNPEIIILPNKIQGYNQLVNHFISPKEPLDTPDSYRD